MLQTLKTMQKQDIFKLFPNDDLGNYIKNAHTDDDVEPIYDDIQRYLKDMDRRLTHLHSVSLVSHVSDFSDKLSYEMFDMRFTYSKCSNGSIYQKEITYGKAGNFDFGIEMFNSTFSLNERKLLKLINHYYISLMSKNTFEDDYFYIPLASLKYVFTNKNNFKMKEDIVSTCEDINRKTIYWDFSKTRYKKKLDASKLCIGQKEKLVDINILYLPKKNKSGIDGKSVEIKGIICKISNFMKMRYSLKQISNRFPVKSLGLDYLGFAIAEKIDYRLNMLNFSDTKKKKYSKENSNVKTEYLKNLRELLDEIYVYKHGKQQRDTYLSIIFNEPNSQQSIIKFIDALLDALNNLSEVLQFKPSLKMRRNTVIYLDLVNDTATSIYNDIIVKGKVSNERTPVKYLIQIGQISLRLNFESVS